MIARVHQAPSVKNQRLRSMVSSVSCVHGYKILSPKVPITRNNTKNAGSVAICVSQMRTTTPDHPARVAW